MGLTYSSVVSAPASEVYEWHERPGALLRLTPPWLPVRVIEETSSLRSGRAVLGLPGGLRWVAEHRASDPPHSFVDELTSLPLKWRHHHRFEAEGEAATRVTDSVETPVPDRCVREVFLYRQRQLADDLGAHQRAARSLSGGAGRQRLTVAISGASGLIGSALAALVTGGGHRVLRLVRGTPQRPDERRWDPDSPDPALLDGVQALVHLAGAPIAGRFTDSHKRAVRDSRVTPTAGLAEVAARAKGLEVFISASAIGYYGADCDGQVLTEDSDQGAGFLAEVVAQWEAAGRLASGAGARVVNVRTGIVQSARGGVLQLLRPVFQCGLGGPLGSGMQWFSWVDLDDLVDIYYRAIVDPGLAGPVNAVAPEPVSNATYASTLAKVLRRPALLPVPAWGPRLVLGAEGSREFALASQRVVPQRLSLAGHHFRHPSLEGCLRHQLGRWGTA